MPEETVLYPLPRCQRANARPARNLCALIWLDAAYTPLQVETALNLLLSQEEALRLRMIRQGDDAFLCELPHVYQVFPTRHTAQGRQALTQALQADADADAFSAGSALFDFLVIVSDAYLCVRALFHPAIMDRRCAGLFAARLTEYCRLLRDGTPVPAYDHRYGEALRTRATHTEEATPAASGHWLHHRLDEQLSAAILACCQARGLSAACLFQAALAMYLHMLRPGSGPIQIQQVVHDGAPGDTLGNFAREECLRIPFDPCDSTDTLLAKVTAASQNTLRQTSSPPDARLAYLPPLGSAFDSTWLSSACPQAGIELIVDNMARPDLFDLSVGCGDAAQAQDALRQLEGILAGLVA